MLPALFRRQLRGTSLCRVPDDAACADRDCGSAAGLRIQSNRDQSSKLLIDHPVSVPAHSGSPLPVLIHAVRRVVRADVWYEHFQVVRVQTKSYLMRLPPPLDAG